MDNLFNTFFMGGFECADHINRSGERVNLLTETQHDKRVREDYMLLAEAGIKTVREGICWSAVEKEPFVYDFREVKRRIEAAEELGIQQVWDLCHFGYPDGLIPAHPKFTERFTALCESFACFYRQCTQQILYVVPINEISFLSWHSGDVRGTVPFAVNSGFDIKYHLCKAAIQGIKALKEIDNTCRVILVEPVVKVHPFNSDVDVEEMNAANEHQFQAMDIIGGLMCPELGGSLENFDILGFNYYYNNQWYHNQHPLHWPDPQNKRDSLSSLLLMAYNRYNRPLILTETGHFGEGRSEWLTEITNECMTALTKGADLKGICIYPVIDRPDWDNLLHYCNCGLWDLDKFKNRVPHSAYLKTLAECIDQVANVQLQTNSLV